jgi:excisionase family DNA binding protein
MPPAPAAKTKHRHPDGAPSAAVAPPADFKSAFSTLEKLVFKLDEFSFVYGVSRSSAYRAMAAGKLRTIKVGRRRLIKREDAEAYLASGE